MTLAAQQTHHHTHPFEKKYLDEYSVMVDSEDTQRVPGLQTTRGGHDDTNISTVKDAPAPSARCMTVAMNNFSLRFEDPQTEHDYNLANSRRQKQRWMRALIVSGLFQLMFAGGDVLDSIEHPHPRLVPSITAPVRLGILGMQVALAVLLWLNLIPASQPWILSGSLAYAAPTLLIFALQKDQMQQWDVSAL